MQNSTQSEQIIRWSTNKHRETQLTCVQRGELWGDGTPLEYLKAGTGHLKVNLFQGETCIMGSMIMINDSEYLIPLKTIQPKCRTNRWSNKYQRSNRKDE